MGWSNGPKTWAELEARLSDGRRRIAPANLPSGVAPHANGGDSPAWSHKRQPYEPALPLRRDPRSTEPAAYAELHCHSNFSFLDGASHPEELVEEAVRLGLGALALTDHDGLYGVVRFAEAARAHQLQTVFGAELTIDATTAYDQRVGRPEPDGNHLVVLARSPVGYGRLARSIATSHLAAGEKGAPRLTLDDLAELARGATSPFRTALRSAPTPEAAIVAQLGERAAHHRAAAEHGAVVDALRIASLHDAIDGDRASIDAAVARHPAAWARADGSGRPSPGDGNVDWSVR
jgi:hypothetical protein